ncbi:electron transfer flavoprotein subunit beta/FixA family protein [Salinibacterium sp. SYSU T00001]|uniref:electron transfer flavoprotein subunit beta/FixA family protein n=1 Tax=Homoserinimonas sedimenticola TaxID=2986805 RepID=UPI002235F0B8|nr:electron transfer flavoprotein subunit beta/FixA family protein [Salinibacterium sedimenticola]MCW4385566.1 electron transfer flavoprotein subunit beta/FixA family protein [Salinibacterium sedimenticola]
MKIVVLIKQVPDTYGERKLTSEGLVDRDASDAIIDEISERALEVALQRKDSDKATEVVVLSMGPAEAKDALRKALSMGADAAFHVLDDALVASDIGWTATTLAAAIRHIGDVDLVIAGDATTDGRGGVVPAMIAEHLGLSHLAAVDGLEIGAAVSGSQATESGSRTVHAPLPAIVSITESADEARFPNFKGIMTAKRKPLTVVSLADLGVDPSFPELARSVIVSTAERPPREGGRKVVDEGNAAAELVEFLASQRLISAGSAKGV